MTTETVRRKTKPASTIKRELVEAMSTHQQAPIVPASSVTGNALVMVVAIMTFLAAITVGSITLVREAALHWRGDLAREITIQVRAREGVDIAAETSRAAEVLRKFPGLSGVRILDRKETGNLLAPWLGQGTDLGVLPVPGLLVARIDETNPPDFAALSATLKREAPDASLDDHRGWSAKLSVMSDGVLLAGFAILALVLASTVLSVSLATRSAVAGNRAIVEVLHFVGARNSYIASVFQRHFLLAAMKGALAGGLAAAGLFAAASLTPDFISRLPGAGSTALLIGELVLPLLGYAGIAVVVLLVVTIATVAARLTVYRTIRSID